MPLSLTTVTTGTAISAAAMRAYVQNIERYLNETLPNGDLQTSAPWAGPTLIYKPEFYGSPDDRTVLTTGETRWLWTPHDDHLRSPHHDVFNTVDYLPVQGLAKTVKIRNANCQVKILATFYTYEFGGDGYVNDTRDHCADFRMLIDGFSFGATTRELYTSSRHAEGTSAAGFCGMLFCRKQYSFVWLLEPGNSFAAKGIHHYGVGVRCYTRTVNGANDDWRHIFVAGRSFVVDYHEK
jgi:hypothetical protein